MPAYIVTTSFYNDAARSRAAGRPIELIDGKLLAEAGMEWEGTDSSLPAGPFGTGH